MKPPFDQLTKKETLQLGKYVAKSLKRIKKMAQAKNQIEAGIKEGDIKCK